MIKVKEEIIITLKVRIEKGQDSKDEEKIKESKRGKKV